MPVKSRFKFTLVFMIIGLGFSCASGDKDNLAGDGFEPRFVITDSLVIDYLGGLNIMDIKPDLSEYLMFDFQRKEMDHVVFYFYEIEHEGSNT